MTLCEGGFLEHSLHHVHLSPDTIDYGHDERETRLEGANITAELLDRPFIPLGLSEPQE